MRRLKVLCILLSNFLSSYDETVRNVCDVRESRLLISLFYVIARTLIFCP